MAPCFMAEQIEFAGNIFLDGVQDSPDFERARLIASTLQSSRTRLGIVRRVDGKSARRHENAL